MKPRFLGKWSAMTGLSLIVTLLAFESLGAASAAESAPGAWAVIAIACVDLVLVTALVARGLDVMRRRERPGLAALFDVAGANGPPTPWERSAQRRRRQFRL